MKSYPLSTFALWSRGLMLALLNVSLVALFIEYAHAQVRFVRAYGRPGYNVAHSVQRTSDGGYIVAGWTSYLGGGGSNILLIKIDTNGDIKWAKTYGATGSEEAYSVQQTSDGGYILAGATIIGVSGNEALLIKTDAFGSVQWAKTYGGTSADFALSVQQTSDGGYIVAGYTWSFGTGGDILLIKTDANGNVQWAKTYGGTGVDYAFSVRQTSDSGYIVAGQTNSFGAGGSYAFLIKTDAFGNVQWAKTYGEAGNDVALSVLQTSDGGYIVAGTTNSFGAGGDDVFLVKIDTFGNLQWVKTYGGTGSDNASSVQQTSDGGYIVAGWTGSNVFLIKTDANGDIGSCSIVSSAIPTLGIISPRVDVASPSVSSPSLSVNSVSLTDTSPALMILIPCPSNISESRQIASGIIIPYKGGIKVSGSGEFEVRVYNVSGGIVKSARGKDEVKLELPRGVYFVEVISGGKVIRERVVIR